MNFTFTKNGNKPWNEDRCYSCDDFAFSIDGATGVSGQKFSNDNSDAEWYSNWWCEYLKTSLNDFDKPVYEILQEGVDKVVKDFTELANGKVILDFPSSTLSIARRLKNNEIEIYIIGDSPVLIQTATGHTLEISDTLNNINDGLNLSTIEYYSKTENLPFLEARKKYNEYVVQGRSTKNHIFGYNILADDRDAILRGVYKKIDGNIFKKVILMTDGYSQVFDLFGLYSIRDLASSLNTPEDAERIYNELYNAQEEDKDCAKCLRFKIRDDATVSVLDISK